MNRATKINSLAIKTDLIFAEADSEMIVRENYFVVRTPANPAYHWGNYLVFDRAPEHGDEKLWPEIFRQEFADLDGVKHIALTWDSSICGNGIECFEKDGYTFESNLVLSASRIQRPEKFNSEVSVRSIESAADWEAVTQNQLHLNESFDARKFEAFKRAQMANYRNMSEAGMGKWFAAFLGDKLVADLGLFYRDSIARFQSVVTHPDYRRLGICGRLVFEASHYALKHFGVDTLVIVADESYHALRVYRSLGFTPVQTSYSLCWYKS